MFQHENCSNCWSCYITVNPQRCPCLRLALSWAPSVHRSYPTSPPRCCRSFLKRLELLATVNVSWQTSSSRVPPFFVVSTSPQLKVKNKLSANALFQCSFVDLDASLHRPVQARLLLYSAAAFAHVVPWVSSQCPQQHISREFHRRHLIHLRCLCRYHFLCHHHHRCHHRCFHSCFRRRRHRSRHGYRRHCCCHWHHRRRSATNDCCRHSCPRLFHIIHLTPRPSDSAEHAALNLAFLHKSAHLYMFILQHSLKDL